MSNYRIDENGNVIEQTDLGADLYPCENCDTKAVLMLNWCYRCREKYPEEFETKLPSFLNTLKDESI